MYKVWINYKDGTHQEDVVPDENTANKLRQKWESLGEWLECGSFLIATQDISTGER